MRHLNPSSRFNQWVLPVRVIGLAIALFGLVRVVAAADMLGIVIAVVGSLVWQCGTFLEMRSPEFRRLNRTLAGQVMRAGRLNVPAHVSVGQLRGRFSISNEDTFFVTMHDGYETGIAMPEQLRATPDDRARYLSVGQVARPISYVDAVRDDDSLLTALDAMDRSRHDDVVVLDRRGKVAGVVTRTAVAGAPGIRKMQPAVVSRQAEPAQSLKEAA